MSASEERILEQLRLRRDELPEWAEVLDLQTALLEAQIKTKAPAVEVGLSAEEATRRQRQGLPLVTRAELLLDWDLAAALYERVCQIADAHRPDLADAFNALRKVADDDPEQLRSWVSRFLVEGNTGTDEPSSVQAFVMIHTLRPFLRRHAEAYQSLVDEPGWRRGYCPICGGEPDLAYLSATEEGARYLLCSRCDNEWQYRRVGCPYCESTDYGQISYYPEEGGSHRLYVCRNCQRYLKTVDLRSDPRGGSSAGAGQILLPVERVLTAAMDVAAQDAGYR